MRRRLQPTVRTVVGHRGVQQFGAGEPAGLVGERSDVYVVGQDHDGRRARLDGITEPSDPFVGDAEIDDLRRDRSGGGSDPETGDPADGATHQEPEQARPHGARQGGATWCRIHRLDHLHRPRIVLRDHDGVLQLE